MPLRSVDLWMNTVHGSVELIGQSFGRKWLMSSWGGEIELAILSEYFQVGIGCVDVKTGHVYNYGTSQSHLSNYQANPTPHAVF